MSSAYGLCCGTIAWFLVRAASGDEFNSVPLLLMFAFSLLYPCCFILKHDLLWAGMNSLYSWEHLTKYPTDVRPTVKERKGAYSEAHREAEGPHRVYTPYPGNHLISSSCNICGGNKTSKLIMWLDIYHMLQSLLNIFIKSNPLFHTLLSSSLHW